MTGDLGATCLGKLMFRALQVSAAPPKTKARKSSQSMQKPNRTDTYHISVGIGECSRVTLAEAAFSPCFSVIAGISEKEVVSRRLATVLQCGSRDTDSKRQNGTGCWFGEGV
jgi:hypothetical protein